MCVSFIFIVLKAINNATKNSFCMYFLAKLRSLQSQHSEMETESSNSKLQSDKQIADLQEQLTESQATNDIHLITIKDLSDKHKVLQVRIGVWQIYRNIFYVANKKF